MSHTTTESYSRFHINHYFSKLFLSWLRSSEGSRYSFEFRNEVRIEFPNFEICQASGFAVYPSLPHVLASHWAIVTPIPKITHQAKNSFSCKCRFYIRRTAINTIATTNVNKYILNHIFAIIITKMSWKPFKTFSCEANKAYTWILNDKI